MTSEEIQHQIRFNQGCLAALANDVRAVPIQRGTDIPVENGQLWLLGYDYMREKVVSARLQILRELPEVGTPAAQDLLNHCLAIRGPAE